MTYYGTRFFLASVYLGLLLFSGQEPAVGWSKSCFAPSGISAQLAWTVQRHGNLEAARAGWETIKAELAELELSIAKLRGLIRTIKDEWRMYDT
ncbi:Protein of unknown function [Pyronema omphalodes CBS 100304]|uniref:Uncharacterized protein n=1 Tax=Pyronema omphalodes (strain CBS 100304) TaxID=1076935 RepID=U4L3C5_PYROM|nr:Protein of unknown function [Pyronema omphalodes CBS 100304]